MSDERPPSDRRPEWLRERGPKSGWAVIRKVDLSRKKLPVLAGAAALVGFLLVTVIAPKTTSAVAGDEDLPPAQASASPAVVESVAATFAPGSVPDVQPNPVLAAAAGADASGLRTYAMPFTELAGLAPETAPGTMLELWVAWDPPVTEEPRVQRLLRNVLMQQILPAPTPELPSVVLIAVRPRDTADLIYGDRYGSLSVTMPKS